MNLSGSRLPLRKKLSGFVHDTAFEKRPQNRVHQTKLRLLDLIGTGIAGGCQNVAPITHRMGRELIEAVVIGYEFFIRLGTAINPDLLLRGFYTTATTGCFSSGAVAAKLLKFSGPQTENVLSL